VDRRWEVALALIQAREIARRVGRPQPVVVRDKVVVPRERRSTRAKKRSGISVRRRLELLDVEGAGELRELYVSADSSSFSIHARVDGVEILDASFDELEDLSPHLDFLQAFEDDGTYVARLQGLRWRDGFKAILWASSPLTVEELYAVWDELG